MEDLEEGTRNGLMDICF